MLVSELLSVIIICLNPKVDRNMIEFEGLKSDCPFSDPFWVEI